VRGRAREPPQDREPERANSLQRVQDSTNALFACITPVPDSFADTVLKAGGFDFLAILYRDHRFFEVRDNRLPTSVPSRQTTSLIVSTVKLVLSLCPLFPQGSLERETLRQFVHFLPQLLHAQGLRSHIRKRCCMLTCDLHVDMVTFMLT
jgi:hypothetical protein